MVEKNKYLEEIINKYSNMVYRLAMTRTGNTENSEDVYQEVFLRLSKKMPSFESEEHIKAWLIRVTINCSKNLLNSSFVKRRTELKEDLVFENPERHDIYYTILKLPLKYKTLIHLYYYEKYTIKEIAQMLSTNENTVKTRLSRARKQLETIINVDFAN